ncbi:hypothetical protein IJG91_02170 [Candidatus Saccharibacteria bacterium]|nr:hypothetical protein [Candidatus Saccharibacteria bacterium]
MENIYVKTYGKVCKPDVAEVPVRMREEAFYEDLLETADIPDDMLYQVYVQLRDDNSEDLERLHQKYTELNLKILDYETPEFKEAELMAKCRSDNLNSFAYAIVSGMVTFFLVDRFLLHVDFDLAMNTLTRGPGLQALLICIPVCLVTYLVSKLMLRTFRAPLYAREFEDEYESTRQECADIEAQYRDKLAMLNVIKRAYRNRASA